MPGNSNGLKDLDHQLQTYIDTQKENVIEILYAPCLKRSKKYVRGAGFFRTSVFRLMTEDLLNFCINGGHITLLTSTQLDLSEYENAIIAYKEKGFKEDLSALLDSPDTIDSTKMLCALIHNERMDIYVAVLRGGIYHQKKGYFEDEFGNRVAFSGSGNETLSALKPYDEGNAEDFNVAWNWKDTWNDYGVDWCATLDAHLSNVQSPFPVVHITEVDPVFIHDQGIDRSLPSHRESAQRRQQTLTGKWDEIFGEKKPPPEPTESFHNLPELRPHQKDGLAKWEEKGKVGILEHATGSGKTITALKAIADHMEKGHDVIVLVPSEPLLYQWEEEIKKSIPGATVSLLGSGNKEGLDALVDMRVSGSPSLVLSLIQSFRSEEAIRELNTLNRDLDKPILLVADECHKLGAPSYEVICDRPTTYRLGLSATPRRQNDSEGTERIFSMLGGVIEPPYTLRDALRDKYLSPYKYHIDSTELTHDEQKRYDELISEIRQLFVMKKEDEPISEYLQQCIFRARHIIRGAENKVDVAVDILAKNYKAGQHWLIYCEGEKMLDRIDNLIRNRMDNIPPFRYWSGMDRFQRKTALDDFSRNSGIMLAIKCLDEGVDIPAISHGIVLSSTKTKREFIQRRGRLLRPSKWKQFATIFDVFALPNASGKESNFVLDEIRRAREFAESALNKNIVEADIRRLQIEYDIGDEDLIEDEEVDE